MTFIAILSVESIETHIAKDREELAKAQASGDEAKVRHYATELEGLETYQSPVSYTHLTLPTIYSV